MKRTEKVILASIVLFMILVMWTLSGTIKKAPISVDLLHAADTAPYYMPVDKEYITISTTSAGLTVSKYYTAATNKILADYAFIIINPNSGGIIVSPDGTNVASTDGPIAAGSNITLGNFRALQKFMAKRAASTNAGLHVWYYKLVN